MDLVNLLSDAGLTYTTSANSIVNINTGDGSNDITVFAGKVSINTGSTGVDNIAVTANSADINTNGSDDKIVFTGNQFDISALGGNNDIQVKGNLNNTTAQNTIKVGDGNENKIRAIANNVDVEAGDTNLNLGFFGNNYGITAGDGQHDIGFWGNNVDIDLAKGGNKIKTLDYALEGGEFNDFGFDKLVDKLKTSTSKVVDTKLASKEIVNSVIDQIAAKYNLSAAEIKILKGINLSAKHADGGPLYILVKSPQKSAAAGKDVYVVAKRDQSNSNHCRAVSNNECINASDRTTKTFSETEVTTIDVYSEVTKTLLGVKNVTVSNESGHNDISLTIQTPFDTSNLANPETDDITLQTSNVKTSIEKNPSKSENQKTVSIGVGSSTWNSPLIVDFNKDGQVSAAAGQGVDIDNNGKADGAATGGDKMLAMTDINGNGSIDGSEVFGDQTVSPFTGEKLNAANGFEALKMIAEQAEKYTGVKCLSDGNVDLAALKQALQSVGMNLGFISDSNVTELEDLGHVASINVSNYDESGLEAGEDVQNRQLGSYTDKDGEKYNVNDVWFTLA